MKLYFSIKEQHTGDTDLGQVDMYGNTWSAFTTDPLNRCLQNLVVMKF